MMSIDGIIMEFVARQFLVVCRKRQTSLSKFLIRVGYPLMLDIVFAQVEDDELRWKVFIMMGASSLMPQ